MNLRELEAQAKALAPMIKGVIDKSIAAFKEALASDLDKRDARLREDLSKSTQPAHIDVEEVARAAAVLIPVPENGKAADPDELRAAVADAFAAIPVPRDGTSVTLEDVTPLIREAVTEAVSAIPAPEPGKSVTPEDVRPLIADEIAKLPAPKDGSSVTLDDVRPLIAEEVSKIPLPKDGTSVTVDDVAPMIRDAVNEAVAGIPPAEPGNNVTVEDVRLLIADEVAKAMQSLQLPSDGEPGRDALQLEILPEIDPDKSYSRSTYAKHRGGLWRSFERTHGMKGWECIVDGVDSIAIDQSGDRGFQVDLILSSGTQVSKALDLPLMIYRGVFTQGSYLPGDTVTWGGSLWHCDEPTNDKPGEQGSKGWRLAVKRGRDGKDGTNGKDLTRGVAL